jgi:hypothetical protein
MSSTSYDVELQRGGEKFRSISASNITQLLDLCQIDLHVSEFSSRKICSACRLVLVRPRHGSTATRCALEMFGHVNLFWTRIQSLNPKDCLACHTIASHQDFRNGRRGRPPSFEQRLPLWKQRNCSPLPVVGCPDGPLIPRFMDDCTTENQSELQFFRLVFMYDVKPQP